MGTKACHADVNDRIVASHLVHLERVHGPGAWHAATLRGAPLGLTPLQLEEWLALEAVPAHGELTLQFRLPHAAVEEAVRPPPAQLAALLLPNFAAAAATDVWRLQLLRLAVSTFCIDACCGAQVRRPPAAPRSRGCTRFRPQLPDSLHLCLRHTFVCQLSWLGYASPA